MSALRPLDLVDDWPEVAFQDIEPGKTYAHIYRDTVTVLVVADVNRKVGLVLTADHVGRTEGPAGSWRAAPDQP